jgi:23S rRNA pseudouridine1911/1915/1917 synthase
MSRANPSATELLRILHEDDDLLVLNKPAGLVCHPTRGDDTTSLVGRVRLHLGTTEGRLVNRLDRETSGVVLVAKGAGVAAELGTIFARESVQKTYWAIVHGHVQRDAFTIDAPLGRDEQSAVAIKDRVREGGAAARTDVRVRQRFAFLDQPVTWVEASPRTGRKHQIRIHLAHAGHAIVGDKIYGADEQMYLRFIAGALTAADWSALILPNHALHACALSFAWRRREWRLLAEPGQAFGAMLTACPT